MMTFAQKITRDAVTVRCTASNKAAGPNQPHAPRQQSLQRRHAGMAYEVLWDECKGG